MRVVWVSSSAAHVIAPAGGVDMNNLDYKTDVSQMTKYGISKAGNVFHAMEFQRRYRKQGVVSVVIHLLLFPLNYPANMRNDRRLTPVTSNLICSAMYLHSNFSSLT